MVFNTELNYIKNDRIRSSMEVLISKIPDYFYKEAASSTGKYHPAFSQGEGGLLRHTKAAVKIANTLLNNETIGYKFTKDNKKETSLTEEEVNLVCSMIETHMGQWNTDFNGNEVLQKPKTKYQRFVHMCDYLAAQKFININFDENNEIIC